MNKSQLRFLAPSRVTPRRARVQATPSQRIYRVIRPFTFDFYAWVLTKDDRCGDRRM